MMALSNTKRMGAAISQGYLQIAESSTAFPPLYLSDLQFRSPDRVACFKESAMFWGREFLEYSIRRKLWSLFFIWRSEEICTDSPSYLDAIAPHLEMFHFTRSKVEHP